MGNRPNPEAGQVTVLAVLLIALVAAATLALVAVSKVLIERTHATALADSVALASAAGLDPATLGAWAGGAEVVVGEGYAAVHHETGSAESWAVPVSNEPSVAPVLVASIARAAQLLDIEIDPVEWQLNSVVVTRSDAASLGLVAHELLLCRASDGPSTVTFELC